MITKLKNSETNEEIEFDVVPGSLRIQQSFDFGIHQKFGTTKYHTSFNGAGPESIECTVVFDQDSRRNISLNKVISFLKSLKEISNDFPPDVYLFTGQLRYKGKISNYTFTPLKMNQKEVVSASLDFTLFMV